LTDGGRRPLARISEDPVVRVAAYYVLLATATALAWQVFPGLAAVFSAERLAAVSSAGSHRDPLLDALGGTPPVMSPVDLALTTALCMIGSFLLMLPVTWVYIFTRQKKGFRQSVVQTLIILPIVVAGVVLLVKNSIALAFSLGGIVAAVSFRNTLRDTKDAVYIFLAIAVGLASGVQVMSAAAVMSIIFNIVVLIFWYTDFGRAPALGTEPGFVACLADLVQGAARDFDRYHCVRCLMPKDDAHRRRESCPNCRFEFPAYLRHGGRR